jgi:taurine dioxygenase
VRFSWRPGSIAFWDNRAVVHIAIRNYGDFPRALDRVLIADEPHYAELWWQGRASGPVGRII